MLGSEILEVAIGLTFVFLLMAVICSAVREGIEAWLKTRAAYLERGIRELLHDKSATGLARQFYNHPMIFGLYAHEYQAGENTERPSILANGRKLPSYIPARNFALALMDIAARGPATDSFSSDASSPEISVQSVRANIMNLGNEPVQRLLLTALDTAQGDLEKARSNIEAWFDSGMDRVSGWYKRSTQWILFGIALPVTIALNVNAIAIGDYLYRNDAARAALVKRAEAAAGDTALGYGAALRALDSLRLPIGWERGVGRRVVKPDARAATRSTPPTMRASTGAAAAAPAEKSDNLFQALTLEATYDWLLIGLGWLLTAAAATLGAPFWFDILNKVMVIRSTVKPHEKSPEESSEDRQKKKADTITIEQPKEPQVQAPGQKDGEQAPAPSPTRVTGDLESGDDMCVDRADITPAELTADEELPAARGGVA